MRLALLVAAAAAPCAAWRDGTSPADLRRAFRKRPYAGSHVAAETPGGVFASMNRHLSRGATATRACEEWGHDALNGLLRDLDEERDPALAKVYANANDKRALHFDSLDYKEALWVEERVAAAAGSEQYNLTRDGKCAEVVMWWVHHLPQRARAEIARRAGFVLPQLPAAGPAMSHIASGEATKEYIYQVQCISCHLVMPCEVYATNQTKGSALQMVCPQDNATHQPHDEPAFRVGGQPEVCPNNPDTGKPWVFYNRTKRCEWDFHPPCGMCEGIGGPIWGDGEDEWRPAHCKPLMKPEDIPKGNLTNPVWPKAFSSTEYVCGSGNNLDACSPKPPPAGYTCSGQKHSGYRLYYHQRDMSEFPHPADWPLTGLQPEQRQDVPLPGAPGVASVHSSQWTLPNGNMFEASTTSGAGCVCFSDPNKQPRAPDSNDPHPGGKYSPGTPDPFEKYDNVLLGPLRWDFPGDAILIGREEIEMEWTSFSRTEDTHKIVVADHWNKGPHHFWFEVATNLMVRQYQTEAALTIQTNWTVGEPDPSWFVVPQNCYKGLLHKNLSCVSPPPVPAP